MFIYRIHKSHLELACKEVEVLCRCPVVRRDDCVFAGSLVKDAAFVREVYEVLWSGSDMSDCVFVHPASLSFRFFGEKRLWVPLLAACASSKVDLVTPAVTYGVFEADQFYIGRLVWTNSEDFQVRKAHNRPRPHPTSLDPQLARCMVNLGGGLSVLDPFCGSGGILLEASLLGKTVTGVDIDPFMIERARVNTLHYGVKATLLVGDALTTTGIYDAIITDVPYGRNSKATELTALYTGFLMHAKALTSRMVIAFPSLVDHLQMIENSAWKVEFSYTIALHRSLSKTIYILSRI